MDAGVCIYCQQTMKLEDLRPYAFDGKLACGPCALETTPERKAEADRRMNEALSRTVQAAEKAGSHILTVGERGYEVVASKEQLMRLIRKASKPRQED